ncbi:hypothetical protein [Sideroxyarcus sp. TK5]
MNKPCFHPFTIIEGGKAESDCKMHLLFNQPWSLSSDEFDQLCVQFEVPRAVAFDLQLMCIRHKAKTNYEAAAVLALFEGSGNASDILAKGRRNSFRLASGAPLFFPQPSTPNEPGINTIR